MAPCADLASIRAAARPAADGSRLTRVEHAKGSQFDMYVYSAAMGKDIHLRVIRPADAGVPRPTLYLLNGSGGGEVANTGWPEMSDVFDFFGDKQVNVVIPVGGKYSYYTDWQRDDPILGRNKWATFLTEELPPVVDSALGTTGANAIAGLSMAGTSVLSLAQSAPGLYKGVASYSGCAETSAGVGQKYVQVVVDAYGGGNTANMWGPVGGPDWVANDPYLGAEKLRGVQLYVATGTGLPGEHDVLVNPSGESDPYAYRDPTLLAQQIVIGGVIEAATNECTRRLKDRLDSLGIPATFDFRPTGTHSWGYWNDDLHDSWPMMADSLGV
ncbi:alpha/beta hydrolase [Rhodococcus sp. NPDC058514]|uniref:alpha/beta hydrolase n=1 Tax=Rhodococcus sp. NPDC058514 TaxID=3346532 RepID=UPI0036529C16